MSDPKQLAQVLELADKALTKALLDLRGARSTVDLLTQQMEQLQNYRLEYLKEQQQQVGSVLNASYYQQYHQMIARIDSAIGAHIQKIQQAQAALEQRQALWHQAQQRQKAIGLLIDKAKLQAQQLAEKKLQQDLDEFAIQQFIRRKT